MLKLLDRFGTEQHKYRLGLHFTSLYVGGQAYLPPGVLHRIVLQRGSKKYSSNYLTVRAACDNPIDEKIQIKATVYFDVSRQQYQEKKVSLLFYVVRHSHPSERRLCRNNGRKVCLHGRESPQLQG